MTRHQKNSEILDLRKFRKKIEQRAEFTEFVSVASSGNFWLEIYQM